MVVKLGTGVLTDAKKQPDLAQMEQLVAQVAQQRQLGRDVVLVSSGAVGAGMGVLNHEKRPSELAELQACAAVGQSRLMTTYEKLFSKFDLEDNWTIVLNSPKEGIMTRNVSVAPSSVLSNELELSNGVTLSNRIAQSAMTEHLATYPATGGGD